MSINSKVVFAVSAIFNMIMALLASFLPQELLAYMGLSSDPAYALLVQILGAFFLGIAMTNYLSKNIPTGGIYNRPVLFGNLAYHGTTAIVFTKYLINSGTGFGPLALLTIAYIALGLAFLSFFFNDPVQQVATKNV